MTPCWGDNRWPFSAISSVTRKKTNPVMEVNACAVTITSLKASKSKTAFLTKPCQQSSVTIRSSCFFCIPSSFVFSRCSRDECSKAVTFTWLFFVQKQHTVSCVRWDTWEGSVPQRNQDNVFQFISLLEHRRNVKCVLRGKKGKIIDRKSVV